VTAEYERHRVPAAASQSPVLAGGSSWFEYEGEDRPHLLRMDLPVSADEMSAALYRDHAILRDTDLAAGRHVWEHAALVIAMDGLTAIQDAAGAIRAQEQRGKLADPRWLALCRQRVTDVTGVRQEQADHAADPSSGPVTGIALEGVAWSVEHKVGGTWRDAMRPEVQTAWHALDRAQLVLYHECADTGDEQLRLLKSKFERATDALIDLVIDELFPETETDDPPTGVVGGCHSG
jgi:hypothetical protein